MRQTRSMIPFDTLSIKDGSILTSEELSVEAKIWTIDLGVALMVGKRRTQ